MNITPCPNFNHLEEHPPVRFCPNCGELVNEKILIKQCSEELHARKRMDVGRFCKDCGEKL